LADSVPWSGLRTGAARRPKDPPATQFIHSQ